MQLLVGGGKFMYTITDSRFLNPETESMRLNVAEEGYVGANTWNYYRIDGGVGQHELTISVRQLNTHEVWLSTLNADGLLCATRPTYPSYRQAIVTCISNLEKTQHASNTTIWISHFPTTTT